MILSAFFGLCTVSPHRQAAAVLRLDASAVRADAVGLDSLARLALIAGRCGYRLVVQRASPDLADLIELAGLSEALGLEPPLGPGAAPPSG